MSIPKYLARFLAPPKANRTLLLIIVATLLWTYDMGWDVLVAILNSSVSQKNISWFSSTPRLVQHILLLPILIATYMTGFKLAQTVRNAFAAALIHLTLAIGFASIVRSFLFIGMLLLTGSVNAPGTEYTGIINATFNPIEFWVLTSLTNLMVYLLGLFIIIGINAHLDLQAERMRTSELNAKWLSARLDTLRGQLNPHFLFNSLHTISALVLADPRRADKLLADLSDVLRITLRDGQRDFATVHEEMEYVRRLLAIEVTRFEDRLTTSFDVDPSTLEARIPSLILQPLVENAIKYGISDHAGANKVAIAVTRENGALIVSVINDFRPKNDSAPKKKMGIGLNNVRERLTAIYGPRFSVTSGPILNERWATSITIPFESR